MARIYVPSEYDDVSVDKIEELIAEREERIEELGEEIEEERKQYVEEITYIKDLVLNDFDFYRYLNGYFEEDKVVEEVKKESEYDSNSERFYEFTIDCRDKGVNTFTGIEFLYLSRLNAKVKEYQQLDKEIAVLKQRLERAKSALGI